VFVFVILINFLFRHVSAGMTDQGVNAINHLEHEWAEIVMLLVVNAVAMVWRRPATRRKDPSCYGVVNQARINNSRPGWARAAIPEADNHRPVRPAGCNAWPYTNPNP
jgi:hypothetical protein